MGGDTPEIQGKCQREKDLAIKARDFVRSKLSKAKEIKLKNFLAKYKFSFLISIIIFLILSLLGYMNYLSDLVLGGGVILEFGSYINDNFNLIFLITKGFCFPTYMFVKLFKKPTFSLITSFKVLTLRRRRCCLLMFTILF